MAAVRQLVAFPVDMDHLAGQLEVHHARQTVGELPDRQLPAAPQAFDAPPQQVLDGQSWSSVEQLFLVDFDPLDGAPDERRRQVADQRLDFGQLRHTKLSAVSCQLAADG